ncbi:hypothetical protein JXA12_04670 [Candidatus Woesearchaeota archaeon]|nr:hypothetical protein [Candidatus Woesearchaeota archaeon]
MRRLSLFFLLFFFPVLAAGFAGLPDIPETPPPLLIPVPEVPEAFPEGPDGGAAGGGMGLPGLPAANTTAPVEEEVQEAVVEQPAASLDEPVAGDSSSVPFAPAAGGESLVEEPFSSGRLAVLVGIVAAVVVLVVLVLLVARKRRRLPSELKKF